MEAAEGKIIFSPYWFLTFREFIIRWRLSTFLPSSLSTTRNVAFFIAGIFAFSCPFISQQFDDRHRLEIWFVESASKILFVVLCVKMSWIMTVLSAFPSSESFNVFMKYQNCAGGGRDGRHRNRQKANERWDKKSELSFRERQKSSNDSVIKRDSV